MNKDILFLNLQRRKFSGWWKKETQTPINYSNAYLSHNRSDAFQPLLKILLLFFKFFSQFSYRIDLFMPQHSFQNCVQCIKRYLKSYEGYWSLWEMILGEISIYQHQQLWTQCYYGYKFRGSGNVKLLKRSYIYWNEYWKVEQFY